MTFLPPTLVATMSERGVPWRVPLASDDVALVEGILHDIPEDVALAVVAALADPERGLWARGVLDSIVLARSAGAHPSGQLSEDVVEFTAADGTKFGLAVLAFEHPGDRWGSRADLQILLNRLDGTFAQRPYVLYLRRPLPDDVDHDGIARAVNLWLSAVERGERHEKHAVYEDGGIAFELTLVESAMVGPRVLTVGPVTALERLAQVDSDVVELAVRLEESLGAVPIVVSLVCDAPWGLPRGYVEQLLYGTADSVETTNGPSGSSYAARFRPNGRSLFSDPVCRNLTGLWWVEPNDDGALTADYRVCENPWARGELELDLDCDRFARVEPVGPTGSAMLRWVGADGSLS